MANRSQSPARVTFARRFALRLPARGAPGKLGVVDVDDAGLADVLNWLQLLAETGSMVILGPLADVSKEDLSAALDSDCFQTEIGDGAILLTRKGSQHNLKRRGRRRR